MIPCPIFVWSMNLTGGQFDFLVINVLSCEKTTSKSDLYVYLLSRLCRLLWGDWFSDPIFIYLPIKWMNLMKILSDAACYLQSNWWLKLSNKKKYQICLQNIVEWKNNAEEAPQTWALLEERYLVTFCPCKLVNNKCSRLLLSSLNSVSVWYKLVRIWTDDCIHTERDCSSYL